MGIEAVWNKVDLARVAGATIEQPQDEADEIGFGASCAIWASRFPPRGSTATKILQVPMRSYS